MRASGTLITARWTAVKITNRFMRPGGGVEYGSLAALRLSDYSESHIK